MISIVRAHASGSSHQSSELRGRQHPPARARAGWPYASRGCAPGLLASRTGLRESRSTLAAPSSLCSLCSSRSRSYCALRAISRLATLDRSLATHLRLNDLPNHTPNREIRMKHEPRHGRVEEEPARRAGRARARALWCCHRCRCRDEAGWQGASSRETRRESGRG